MNLQSVILFTNAPTVTYTKQKQVHIKHWYCQFFIKSPKMFGHMNQHALNAGQSRNKYKSQKLKEKKNIAEILSCNLYPPPGNRIKTTGKF